MKKQLFNFFISLLVLETASINLLRGQNLTPADIMAKYGKAVVLIVGIKNGQEIGLGSGFIVKSDGVIITNHHVIAGSYPAVVKIRNGDMFEDISVIDFSERHDIAVIKVKGYDLPTVSLGNSNNIKIGERVVVIGNPQGFENTISDGLLSQIRDSGKGYLLHQISAPISPGSSGSPVFNQRGEVIGIATLSAASGQNLNFSIPINYGRGMIDGPIKYSLEEFASLEKEPTLLSETNKTEIADNRQALEKFNNIIIAFFGAIDNAYFGMETTGGPHRKKFDANKYRIDAMLYSSNQAFKSAFRDLDAIGSLDSDLQALKGTLQASISRAVESSDTLVAALERTGTNSWGNRYPFPDWSKANSSQQEFMNCINRLDRIFVSILIEKTRKECPELESFLLPYFFDIYDDKEKKPEEIAAENSKMGHLSIRLRYSTRLPIILDLKINGPADRAGMKRGDLLLSVEGGPEFKTQMDYRKFQITTKPGESYAFHISRDGKATLITVKLE